MTDCTITNIWIPYDVYAAHTNAIDDLMSIEEFINDGDSTNPNFQLFKNAASDGGGSHLIGQLVDAEIPFAGFHGKGHRYLAHLFTSTGLEKAEIPIHDDGIFYTQVKVYRGQITVDQNAVGDMLRFRELIRAFDSAFGNPHMALFGDFIND